MVTYNSLNKRIDKLEKKAVKLGVVQINFNKSTKKTNEKNSNNLNTIVEELDAIEYGLNYIEKEHS